MAPQSLAQLHQSTSAAALPGTWKLQAGRAITLQPSQAGHLRVAHGQLWATFDGPHGGAPDDSGDHVIGAGGRLWVRAGQRVVIQAWDQRIAAYFSWEPVAARSPVRAASAAHVRQSLADLRLALGFGARALARLAGGALRLGWELVALRVREPLDACARSAQSKAVRAHGAMS